MTELSRIQYRTDTNWPEIKPSAIFSMLLLFLFLEYPQDMLNSSESYGNLWRTVFETTNVVTRKILAHTAFKVTKTDASPTELKTPFSIFFRSYTRDLNS